MSKGLVFGLLFVAFGWAQNPVVRGLGDVRGGLVIPRLAAGGAWEAEFQVFSLSDRAQPYILTFFDAAGEPMEVLLTDTRGQIVSEADSFPGVLQAGGADILISPRARAFKVGYARVEVVDPTEIAVNVVLTQVVPGRPDFQASVPGIGRYSKRFRFPFRNRDRLTTSIAWVSEGDRSGAIIARGPSGSELCREEFAIAAGAHEAFILSERLPCTSSQEGTIEVETDEGGITPIAFLFNDFGTFTTQLPIDARPRAQAAP